MKRFWKRLAALTIAPGAVAATAADQAWASAQAEGTIEAYTRAALEHPELTEAARQAIASTDLTDKLAAAARDDSGATDQVTSRFRDIQII